MIEVLVALFVVSFGFLAGANMQMKSLQKTQESLFKTQAVRLAQSVVESMRANPEGVALGAYDDVSTNNELVSTGCLTSGCTAENLAIEDIIKWKTALSPSDGSLPVLPKKPNGDPAYGTVSKDGNGVFTITMFWQQSIDSVVADNVYQIGIRL